MKKYKVKTCGDCPLLLKEFGLAYCGPQTWDGSSHVTYRVEPLVKPPGFCPLRDGKIVIKLDKDAK